MRMPPPVEPCKKHKPIDTDIGKVCEKCGLVLEVQDERED